MKASAPLLLLALLACVGACRESSESARNQARAEMEKREADVVRKIAAGYANVTDFSEIRGGFQSTAILQETFQRQASSVYYWKTSGANWDAHYDHAGQLWIVFDGHADLNSVQIRLKCDRTAADVLLKSSRALPGSFVLAFKVETTFVPSMMVRGEFFDEYSAEVAFESEVPLIVIGELLEARSASEK